MSEWQPIETCPENTWVLTYASWGDPPYVFISKFRWVELQEWVTESETVNAGGRRKIVQEKILKERQWEGWGGDFWMPIPAPPHNPDVRTTDKP
jgi:hypothetical protein